VSFETAYAYTKSSEGGWVNDPVDAGKETFRGISRRSFPKWEGWKQIDKVNPKNAKTVDAAFAHDENMQRLVEKFYEGNFYAACATLGAPDRATAKIFDFAVNAGFTKAAKFAQEILGVTQDGIFGPKTRQRAYEYFQVAGSEGEFLKRFAKRQADFYRAIVAKNPSQAKFLRGWLIRANYIPK
jgi:lysozyme family protein